MRLFHINGKLVYKNVKSKRIKWRGKSRSKLQKSVKDFLKLHWQSHIVFEEFPVYGTRLSVDFLNATKKIAIEVNGKQHSDYVKFFHGSRNGYLESIKRDVKKAEWLEMNNFKLIEINEDDVEKLSLDYIEKTFKVSIV